MIGYLSPFNPKYPKTLVYMLQSCEYQVKPYLKWWLKISNFNKVAKRRQLKITAPALALLSFCQAGMVLQIVFGIVLMITYQPVGIYLGLALLLSYPIIWAWLMPLPILLGRWLIIAPINYYRIKQSTKIFNNHHGVVIAVAGSYGKTTLKELLKTILSEGKKVAATPGNKNVASSHANFARRLKGDEDILIVEFGEGKPGDIKRFTETIQPDYALITGIAPAHLDKYKTIEAVVKDMDYLVKALPANKVYINGDDVGLFNTLPKNIKNYSAKGVDSWKVNAVKCLAEGLSFKITKGSETTDLKSPLIGEHLVGPLVAAVDIASELGLSLSQIKQGVAKTHAFEHRMQPYQLGGAWIIDDTYNGNLEGMRAGLELLKKLPAKRKIYVTPGLVDQGKKSKEIHNELGELVAKASPDMVVLMQNSVTKDILAGIKKGNFKNEISVQSDPLNFYTNLASFVAAGDLVLMQNDWTDNYY